MRILYDGQIYSMQAVGGINRYFANLIGRLPENSTPYLLVDRVRGLNYPEQSNLKVYRYGSSWLKHVSHRAGSYYSKFATYYAKHITSLKRFDVAHPTYYTLLTRREVNTYRCPVVLTVWDMIHELFPAEMDPTGQHAEEKRKAILAAQAVICISENTRKDLLERYSLPEEKVRVTHLASNIDASISYGPHPVPCRPYFMYVGSRTYYKNFDGLLAALKRVTTANPDVTLCVVGHPFDETERNVIADLKLTAHIEHYGYVDDEHLAKLYRCSIAFVYPSLYEGFGIPVLEAMSCGTVVVASNSSSLPEVVGDAGVLFDPYSTDDLAQALTLLLDDPVERERLIAKGSLRAQEFSWYKTVSETIDVYRSVCG